MGNAPLLRQNPRERADLVPTATRLMPIWDGRTADLLDYIMYGY